MQYDKIKLKILGHAPLSYILTQIKHSRSTTSTSELIYLLWNF